VLALGGYGPSHSLSEPSPSPTALLQREHSRALLRAQFLKTLTNSHDLPAHFLGPKALENPDILRALCFLQVPKTDKDGQVSEFSSVFEKMDENLTDSAVCAQWEGSEDCKGLSAVRGLVVGDVDLLFVRVSPLMQQVMQCRSALGELFRAGHFCLSLPRLLEPLLLLDLLPCSLSVFPYPGLGLGQGEEKEGLGLGQGEEKEGLGQGEEELGQLERFDGISGREWHEPLRAFSASTDSDPTDSDGLLLPQVT